MINTALYIHFIDIFQAKSLAITKISKTDGLPCEENHRRIQRQDTGKAYTGTGYKSRICNRIKLHDTVARYREAREGIQG